MSNPLLDALGFLGDTLDTPGSIARGLIHGDPGRAFGGIFDPSQRVSGREMLGLEEGMGNELLGIGAGILTDPLTYLGGLGLVKGIGKLRGGKAAAEAIGAAPEAMQATRVAEETSPFVQALMEGPTSSAMRRRGPKFDFTDMFAADANEPQRLAQMAKGLGGQPKGPLTSMLDEMVAAEQASPLAFKDVMGMRRQTPVVMNLNPETTLHPNALGFYKRGQGANVNLPNLADYDSVKAVQRHELSHGLTDLAPRASARGATRAGGPQGSMADELLAVASESPVNSASRVADFLGHDVAKTYLKDFGLLGTPYEEFATQFMPNAIRSLPQGSSLVDYLRMLAGEAGQRGLSVGAPLGGSALLAALMGYQQEA
jgi:hypothetical protein